MVSFSITLWLAAPGWFVCSVCLKLGNVWWLSEAAVVVWQNTLRSKEDLNPKGVVLLGFLQQLQQNLTLGHIIVIK